MSKLKIIAGAVAGIVCLAGAVCLGVFSWRDYQTQQEQAAGREEADAAGLNPIAKYDHRWENVPGTLKGRYCFTEEGTERF